MLLCFTREADAKWLSGPWRRRNVALNLATACLGIVLMGPNTYLPTFGQSVLGLGAIAAGLLLATISLGWPLASSWSGRLYLRIGFRNTALIGAVLALAATLLFALLPQPQSIVVLVLIHVLLGAGFYFRYAMATATVHVYLGITIAALVMLLAVLGIRRGFAMQQADERGAEAANAS